MKGIVFAAGIGSRLKPFTDSHPKALAMIGERSLLEIVIDRMVSAGVDSIVVNAHHFAEQIFSFVRNRSFGVPVEISDESALLLDTAGAITKIERDTSLLKNVPDNEPVLIHNSDILTDFPISEMLGQHVASQADATLLVDPQRTSTRGFLFDSSGRLCAWHNSTTGDTIPEGTDISTLNQAAFGGVHILRAKTVRLISHSLPARLEPAGITPFYAGNAAQLDIRGFAPALPYKWFDIGTPQKLENARRGFYQ